MDMSLALPYINNCNTGQTSGPGGQKISGADLRQYQSVEYKLFYSTLWSPDFCSTKTLKIRKDSMEQKGWGSWPSWDGPLGCVGSWASWLSSPKAENNTVDQSLFTTKANTQNFLWDFHACNFTSRNSSLRCCHCMDFYNPVPKYNVFMLKRAQVISPSH